MLLIAGLTGLGCGVVFAGTELYRPWGILPPLGPALFPSLLLARQSHTWYGVKAPLIRLQPDLSDSFPSTPLSSYTEAVWAVNCMWVWMHLFRLSQVLAPTGSGSHGYWP